MPDFSPDLERAFTLALAEAQRTHSRVLGTPHLFIGLTKLDGVTTFGLRAQGHDPKQVRDAIRARIGTGDASPGEESALTSHARANLKRAKALAVQESASAAEERHLLAAIFSESEGIMIEVLRKLGVNLDALGKAGVSRHGPLTGRAVFRHVAQAFLCYN